MSNSQITGAFSSLILINSRECISRSRHVYHYLKTRYKVSREREEGHLFEYNVYSSIYNTDYDEITRRLKYDIYTDVKWNTGN